MAIEEFPVLLPRNAFGPRETARAGDLWRAFQDAAIVGSTRRGWPPERYREHGCAFVVRGMVVVHHDEARFGEPLLARTWVSSFRRGTLTDRQVRIVAGDRPIASATQRWVHIVLPDLKPVRAAPDLERSFVVVEGEADAALPAFEPLAEGPERALSFEAWHTWMDPLGHANHPAYVDWADEALSRWIAEAGADPQSLRPLAEEVTWRSGVMAPERVTVRTSLAGRTDGAAVLRHVFEGGDGRLCAEATTVRGLAGAALFDVLGRCS